MAFGDYCFLHPEDKFDFPLSEGWVKSWSAKPSRAFLEDFLPLLT